MSNVVEHSAMRRLGEELEGPIFNPILKKYVGEGKLDYERYLKTSELLALQSNVDELVSADEMMFQIAHQAQEVWLKLMSYELGQLVGDLDGDDLWEASQRLERIVRIGHCLAGELKVLETLTPDAYQVIRRHLGGGSGQESPGYNRLLLAATYVAQALERLTTRRAVTPMEVYTGSAGRQADLKRVLELLVDVDEGYQMWLVTHFMLVRRTIGVSRNTAALDGVPTQVLTGRMTQPLFRELWKVREEMTAAWDPSGGYAPGEERSAKP